MFLSGIDIGGTSIKFGIFDEQLNLLQQWSRPTPKEPAEAAALIAAQLEPYHVAAIGAGAPGTLNAACETITADNLAWVDVCAAAPAVVFAFGTREEAAATAQAAEALAAHNPRFCAVCLAEPDALQHYPFAASTVSAWDRTEPAMRAVCRALANPQI